MVRAVYFLWDVETLKFLINNSLKDNSLGSVFPSGC